MEAVQNWLVRLYFRVNHKMVVFVISRLFILLYLYAALNKILDFEKFKVQLGQSPILTDYAWIIAWLIPGIEIIISILLLFQRTLVIGLYSAFGLMVMFTAYIIVILNFADRIPCSCGGILERMGWNAHLVFNIGFVFLGIVGVITQSKIQEKQAMS